MPLRRLRSWKRRAWFRAACRRRARRAAPVAASDARRVGCTRALGAGRAVARRAADPDLAHFVLASGKTLGSVSTLRASIPCRISHLAPYGCLHTFYQLPLDCADAEYTLHVDRETQSGRPPHIAKVTQWAHIELHRFVPMGMWQRQPPIRTLNCAKRSVPSVVTQLSCSARSAVLLFVATITLRAFLDSEESTNHPPSATTAAAPSLGQSVRFQAPLSWSRSAPTFQPQSLNSSAPI